MFERYQTVNINGESFTMDNLNFYTDIQDAFNYNSDRMDELINIILDDLPKIHETYEAAYKLLPLIISDNDDVCIRAINDCDSFLRSNASLFNRLPVWNRLLFLLHDVRRIRMYMPGRIRRERIGREMNLLDEQRRLEQMLEQRSMQHSSFAR